MNRTLNIKYTGLTQNANVMFCMTPPDNTKLGRDNNLVAWKVVVARKGQTGSAGVTYTSRYAVGESELDDGNLVQGSIVRELLMGQQTSLQLDEDGYSVWSPPEKGTDGLIKAYNKSGYAKAISIGTVKGSAPNLVYEPSFMWARVGAGLFVESQLTPKLLVYVNLAFKENEMIRADISSDLLTTIDLAGLPPTSNWVFAETPQGGYSLTRSNALELPSPGIDNPISRPGTPNPGHPLPPVKITYSLKLKWNKHVTYAEAMDTITTISTACNSRGLVCVIQNPGDDHYIYYRDIQVSRRGVTAQRITDTFANILDANINSNWSVDNELWTNVSAKLEGNDVLEFVAPKSLAYYYANTDYGFPAPLTQVQVSDGGVSSPNLRRKRHWEFLLSSLNSIAATLGWKRIGMLSTTIFIMVIALIWKSFLRSRTLTPSVPTPSPGEGSSVVQAFCAEFMALKLDFDH